MISLEVIHALVAAGCTAAQLAAAIRADRERGARLRAERKARLAAGDAVAPAGSPLQMNKPDSVAASESGSRPASIGGYPKAIAKSALLGSLELKPAAKLVGAVLVEHYNLATGRCDPGIATTISPKTGLSERSVRRALSELERAGLLRRRVHGGRYHANAYEIRWDALSALGAANKVNNPDSAPANRTLVATEPDSRVRQNMTLKQNPSVDVERAVRARRPDPRQPQMLLPLSNRGIAADAAAQRRVMDDIEREAKVRPSFNVSALTEGEWADVNAAERQSRGQGIVRIREMLEAKPARAASG